MQEGAAYRPGGTEDRSLSTTAEVVTHVIQPEFEASLEFAQQALFHLGIPMIRYGNSLTQHGGNWNKAFKHHPSTLLPEILSSILSFYAILKSVMVEIPCQRRETRQQKGKNIYRRIGRNRFT
ncbi:MAG: hypothetical protein ACYC5X_01020 [Syntrophales bacterium]